MNYEQSNYYLKLLKQQIKSLKEVVDMMNNESVLSDQAYNSILSGLIIKINVIMEQTLSDYHSEEFSDFTASVYNLRQIIVHYHDYKNMTNIKQASVDVIKEFAKLYPGEKEFYNNLLNYDDSDEYNFVIRANNNIYYDEDSSCYVLKNDKDETLLIKKDNVIKIKNLKKGKVEGYIVKVEGPINLFYKDENGNVDVRTYNGRFEYEQVLNQFSLITGKNYKKYKENIKKCIENLYFISKDSPMNIYVQEKGSNAPIKSQISKVLNQFFNENSIYTSFMKDIDFIHMNNDADKNIQFTNFSKLREDCEKDLISKISKKDYFFIHKTIVIFNNLYNEIRNNECLENKYKEPMVMAFLIKWVDQCLNHMSPDFINANEEFKKVYDYLISYRNYYAHNIQQLKNSNSYTLEPFLETAKGYVSIVNSLHIDKITNNEEKREVKFVAIESMVDDFVNYKYGQYIKIAPTTFIGNKLFYSVKGDDLDKMMGLIPVDRDYPLSWSYYTLKDNELVSKGLKKKNSQKTRLPECDNKIKVKFDVNLNDLLYLYCLYNGVIGDVDLHKFEAISNHKLILFTPSVENNFQAHATPLDDIITNYYMQRYLPIELIKETQLKQEILPNGKIRYVILDKEGAEIARVLDSREARNNEINVDKKDKFNIRKTIRGI